MGQDLGCREELLGFMGYGFGFEGLAFRIQGRGLGVQASRTKKKHQGRFPTCQSNLVRQETFLDTLGGAL